MVDYGDGKKASQAGARAGPGGPRSERHRPTFGEIVGQAEFKQALLVVAANDDLDGLLVSGEKGTAKSTAVRALADLLPDQRAVADCPYGCPPDDPAGQCADCRDRDDLPVETRPVPLVTLPLGATRDRVVGTLSVEDAIDGNSEFEPGLLARANRGILYVDEVNLLDDHLVDVLLDAAAGGVNRVERDGVSVSHPAEFTLIGTMNPEEGDLRPQLRDRFALQATVTGCREIDDRVAIIRQALGERAGAETDTDPAARLRRARDGLADVVLPDEFATEIAQLCRDAGVDGHRGDIATARAARALAALAGRARVIESDVRRAAELALPHRLQSRPFEDAPDPEDVLDDHFEDEAGGDGSDDDRDESGDAEPAPDERGDGETEDAGTADDRDDGGDAGPDSDGSEPTDRDDGSRSDEREDGDRSDDPDDQGGPDTRPSPTADSGADGGHEPSDDSTESSPDSDGADEEDAQPATPLLPGQQRAAVGDAAAPDLSAPDSLGRAVGSDGGSRARSTPSSDAEGARVRTERAEAGDSVDAAASIRAAARRGGSAVQTRDLRQSVRAGETGVLVLFVVDASASMRGAMRTAKGTVLELLQDAYEARDEVGFVAVAGDEADVVLPPTDSVTRAARHLKDLPTGDRTPLPDGLRTARTVLERADPDAAVVVLVTDGRANVAEGSPTAETRAAARELATLNAETVVVDAGDGSRAEVTDLVCDTLDAERVPLSALSADRVTAAVDRN
ncbi:protoporphyrin IX magnesium-chelatase [Halorientalis persicus]|jgi:magnesium chelatase subunit D|uniref:Protoporphyrin IX magnesium-chelatase n=1 Tax=Halorientalis persicus TaxID=1367881 RepID=A0A1H8NDX5_9EURY|nr:VWA domain-containing protein [Halorientalis persicus]SEO27931.1 protoporphyrin IX magnesium-chelatase [Halorientalis persicus]